MSPQVAAPERTRALLLKLDEVAARLACSRRYVDELIRKRRLHAVRLGASNKTIRVREFDLMAFCNALPAAHAGAA